MTTAGTRDGESVRRLRALTAVLALYALVMQAFLGGIVASAAAAPSALPFDVHCLDQTERADPSAPQAPAHHHTGCCTVAHPAAAMPPPLPAITAIVWPQPIVVHVIWRMQGIASARAPPFTLASARAPPAA